MGGSQETRRGNENSSTPHYLDIPIREEDAVNDISREELGIFVNPRSQLPKLRL